jgi:hypothetical protein
MNNLQNFRRDASAFAILAVPVTLAALIWLRGDAGLPGGLAMAPGGGLPTLPVGMIYRVEAGDDDPLAPAAKPEPKNHPPMPEKGKSDQETEAKMPTDSSEPSATAPIMPDGRATNPASTAVEPAPKPVRDMEQAELRETVEKYKQWCHDGKIQITLVRERVLPEAFERIVEFYVLSSISGRIKVLPGGGSQDLGDSSVNPGRLVGHLERTDWPKALESEANRLLGGQHKATAIFVLNDEGQLMVYRALGTAIGDKRQDHKAEYRLLLSVDHNSHELIVRVLNQR